MSEVKVITTLGEINNVGVWEKFCDKYGYSYWCMNEGQAESTEKVEISFEDAKYWGLIGETVEDDWSEFFNEPSYEEINKQFLTQTAYNLQLDDEDVDEFVGYMTEWLNKNIERAIREHENSSN